MAPTTVDVDSELKAELLAHPERFGVSDALSLRRALTELLIEGMLLRRARVEEARRCALYADYAANPEHAESIDELFTLAVADAQ